MHTLDRKSSTIFDNNYNNYDRNCDNLKQLLLL